LEVTQNETEKYVYREFDLHEDNCFLSLGNHMIILVQFGINK